MSIFCSCKDKSITTNCSVPALMDKMGRIKMSHQKYRLFENVLLSFCPSVVICNNVAVKIEVERRRWNVLCYEWVNVKSAFGQCLVWLAERKIIIQISFKRKNLYKLPFLSQQGSGKIILFSSIQTYFDHPNNHPKFAIITSEMIIMSIASSWWSFLLLSLLMSYCKMSCRKDWSFCPVEIQIARKCARQ